MQRRGHVGRGLAGIVVVGAALLVTGLLASGSTAEGTAELLFSSDRGSDEDLYLMPADGGAPPQLLVALGGDQRRPAWPADGSTIAFTTGERLWVVDADGSNPRQLTDVRSAYPTWSPDGTRLAFQGSDGDDWEIYTVAADGTGLSQLTDNDVADQFPAWGASGIAVSRSGVGIAVVDPDSGADTAVVATGTVRYPTWAPDGDRLAVSQPYVRGWRIAVVDVAAGTIAAVTDEIAYDWYPDWSPDGQRIAFSRTAEFGGDATDWDLWTVAVDGSDRRQLTSDGADDRYPAWRPGVVEPPGDAAPPSWDAPQLAAPVVTDSSVLLEWSEATDDTGVTGYEVVRDGATVAQVTTTTFEDAGLRAETGYRYEVQALDAAGNRSDDGPTLTVRTTPALRSGHVGPSPSAPTIGWTSVLPFEELDRARSDQEVLVVASTGATAPVVARLSLLTPADLDVDRDGGADLRARLRLDTTTGGPLPAPALEVTRLADPGPADVEVLGLVPLGVDDPAAPGPLTAVVGFRTAAPGGGAGGTLPASETIRFEADRLGGLSHNFSLGFDTAGATGPLRFLAGAFAGDRTTGALAPDVVSALVDAVPTQVEAQLTVEAAALSAAPTLDAALTWRTPDDEARSPVRFAFLQGEGRAADPAAHGTSVLFSPMAHIEELALRFDAADALTVVHTASDTTDRIAVEHRRSDGFALSVGLDDVPTQVTATVGDVLEIVAEDDRVDASLTVHHPSGDLLDGATSHPIRHLHAAVQDAPSLVLAPRLGAALGFDLQVAAPFSALHPTVTFVAADDLADLRWPAHQSWPAGPPAAWPPISGSGPVPLDVAVVDDADGSTIGLRTARIRSLAIDLSPETLASEYAFALQRLTRLDLAVDLGAGTPLAPALATQLSCGASLPGGDVTFSLDPPRSYALHTDGTTTSIDCAGQRGGRSFAIGGSSWPARVALDLDPLDGPDGGLTSVVTDSTGAPARARNATLVVRDPERGLSDDVLLGAPLHQLGISAGDLPSTRATWANLDADATVSAVSQAPEDPIGRLQVELSTAADDEVFSPSVPHTSSVRASAGDHYLRLWEHSAGTRLGFGVRQARELNATHGGATGQVTAEVTAVAAWPFVADLSLPVDGVFSDGRGLRGGCEVRLAAGHTRFEARVPERLFVNASPAGPSDLRCDVRVDDPGEDLDVRVLASSGQLPRSATLTTAPTGVGLDLVGGTAEFVAVELRDRSGTGLPRVELLGQDLSAAAVRVDEAASGTIAWTSSRGVVHVTAQGTGPTGSLGTVQAELTSTARASIDAPSEAGHRFELADDGPDGDATVLVQVTGLRRLDVAWRDEPGRRLVAALEAATDQPLAVDVFAGFDSSLTDDGDDAAQLTAAGAFTGVPGELTYRTNLTTFHRILADAGVDGLEAHAEYDDDREDTDPEHVLTVDLETAELPVDVTIDGVGLEVDAADTLGLVDLVLADPRPAGVLGHGPNRIRLRAEDVPTTLEIDTSGLDVATEPVTLQGDSDDSDDPVLALDGTMALAGRTGGPIGRLLVELTDHADDEDDDPSLFGAPFAHLTADLHGVPAGWTLALSREADSRDVDASLTLSDDAGDDDALDRVAVTVLRDPPGDDPGAALAGFADPAPTTVAWTASQRDIDVGYWPRGVRAKMATLYGRGFGLDVGQATPPPAPDGLGGTATTVAQEDHVLADTDRAGLRFASLRLSDVHAIDAAWHDDLREATLTRSTGTTAGPLFVGTRDRGHRPGYPYPDEPFPVAPYEPGAPRMRTDDISKRHGRDAYLLDVLANDADGDAPIDPSTLAAVMAVHGSVEVEDGLLRYTPPPNFAGYDRFRYEVCDQDGRCSEGVGQILLYEVYDVLSAGHVEQQPDRLTVSIEGGLTFTAPDEPTEWRTDAFAYDASGTPGRVDLYDGPLAMPPVSDHLRRSRVRIAETPSAARIDLSLLHRALPGQLGVDTNGTINAVAVVDERPSRVVAGVRGEDLVLSTTLHGALVDGIDGLFSDADFADCDRVLGFGTCLRLFRLGVALRGVGDATGTTAEGFVGTYAALESSGELVPRLTAMVRDLRRVGAEAEFQLEPTCVGQCELPPIDFEVRPSLRSGRAQVDFWDLGFLLCVHLPLYATPVCGPGDSPDYLTGRPWPLLHVRTPFDPYQ